MIQNSTTMTPEQWFQHLFASQAARDGGVVRRKVRDMERYVGRDTFAAELHRRGYSAVENGGQVIIFCNAEPLKIAVSPRNSFQELSQIL